MDEFERLAYALQLFAEFQGSKIPPGVWLDRHPGFRDLLEPMLEQYLKTSPAAEQIDPATLGSPPQGRIGRYQLFEKLGEGGMGTVFRAEQVEPFRRTVALKVIRVGMDTGEAVRRFEAERQALAVMDHVNIAKVFDAGQTEDYRPYFVMEHLPGVSITEYADREQLTPRQRIELLLQVCDAVEHAHSRGVVHRDLKPSNILVTGEGTHAVPKVIDFGIAKALDEPLTNDTLHTRFGQVIGTPSYMSPEQFDRSPDRDLDQRTDVYSLGVILYELLVGDLPFDWSGPEMTDFSAAHRLVRDRPVERPSSRLSTGGNDATTVAEARGSDARSLQRSYRGEMDWIVLRCLEFDRERRYQSAAALADDLRRYLDHQPVVARPPSRLYRLQRFLRRHRVAAVSAAASLLFVGLFVLIVGSYTGWNLSGLAGGGVGDASPLTDCDGNGRPDDEDIARGILTDCDGNGIPDECELASGDAHDANANGTLDRCDIASGSSLDRNRNGVPDECAGEPEVYFVGHDGDRIDHSSSWSSGRTPGQSDHVYLDAATTIDMDFHARTLELGPRAQVSIALDAALSVEELILHPTSTLSVHATDSATVRVQRRLRAAGRLSVVTPDGVDGRSAPAACDRWPLIESPAVEGRFSQLEARVPSLGARVSYGPTGVGLEVSALATVAEFPPLESSGDRVGDLAGTEYGAAVAIRGGLAVVGSPSESRDGVTEAGAVSVYRWNGAAWVHEATLSSPSPAQLGWFGVAVATDGEWIVVGESRQNLRRAGEVHLYRREEGEWRAESSFVGEGRLGFGASVAVDDGWIAVGCDPDDRGAGEVRLFERQGDRWERGPELSILESPSVVHRVRLSGRRLGVAVDGTNASPGGVQLFIREGEEWAREFDRFSKDLEPRTVMIDLHGETLVVNEVGADESRVGIHRRGADGVWLSHDVEFGPDRRVGLAVGAAEDAVAIPVADAARGPQLVVLRYDGAAWIESIAVTPAGFEATDPDTWTMALHGDTGIVGGPGRASIVAGLTGRDLDCDGIPDARELVAADLVDCDHNLIADTVEIRADETLDRNLNGVLDRCDLRDGGSVDIDGNGVPDESESLIRFVGSKRIGWSSAEYWSTGRVPESGDDVLVTTAALIEHPTTLRRLVLGPRAELTLADDARLTVDDLTTSPGSRIAWQGSPDRSVAPLTVRRRFDHRGEIRISSNATAGASLPVLDLANTIERPPAEWVRELRSKIVVNSNSGQWPLVRAVATGTESNATASGRVVAELWSPPCETTVASSNGIPLDAAISESVAVLLRGVTGSTRGARREVAVVHRWDGSRWREEQVLEPVAGAFIATNRSRVAVDGDVVVIGYPIDVSNGMESGAAYVYRFDGRRWNLEQRLTDPAGEAGDGFGAQVAIDGSVMVIGTESSREGDTLFVYRYDGSRWVEEERLRGSRLGAGRSVQVRENRIVAGMNDGAESHGGVIIFAHDGVRWSEAARLSAPAEAAAVGFGHGVSFDGERVAVTAPAAGSANGTVHVYRRAGTSWLHEQAISAPGDFGRRVAIVGEWLGVSQPTDPHTPSAGGVHLYRFDRDHWVRLGALDGTRVDGGFGSVFAMSETQLLIRGADRSTEPDRFFGYGRDANGDGTYDACESAAHPAPHYEPRKIIARSGGPNNFNGFWVCVDGDVAISGAANRGNHNPPGTAHIYRRIGGTWVEEQTLSFPESRVGDNFGRAVGISGDWAIVGCTGASDDGESRSGAVLFYRYDGQRWSLAQTFTAERDRPSKEFLERNFGGTVSIEGDVAVAGTFTKQMVEMEGFVRVYRLRGTTWVEEQQLEPIRDPETASCYGHAVALYGDVIVVGANRAKNGKLRAAGAAWVYRWNGSAWVEETKLVPNDPGFQDTFGRAITIGEDEIIVSASLADAPLMNSGAVYVFRRVDGEWRQQEKLVAEGAEESESFGASVALDGDVLAISTPMPDTAGKDSGSLFIFRRLDGAWVQEAEVTAPDGHEGMRFGERVSASGGTIMIGAPRHTGNGYGTGAVYFLNVDD